MALIYSDGTMSKVAVYAVLVNSNEQVDYSPQFVAISKVLAYAVSLQTTVPTTVSGTLVTFDSGGTHTNVPCIVLCIGTGILM